MKALISGREQRVAPHQLEHSWASKGSFPSTEERDATVAEYLRGLWRRKWVIVASILTTVALVTIVSVKMQPLYEAFVLIAIYRESPVGLNTKSSDGEVGSGDGADYTVTLDTQVKILEGDDLAAQVINSQHLDKNPNFAQSLNRDAANNPASGQELQERFRKSLKVAILPHTQLLEIRFRSPDPRLAAQVSNAIAEAYIERNYRGRYDSTMQTSNRLLADLVGLKQKVDSSRENLVQYQKQHDILGVDEKQNIITSKLDELNRDLTAAEADRMQKESEYRLVESNNADSVARVEPNSLLQTLRARRSELSVQYAQVHSQLGPAHPKVIALNNELNDLDSAVKAEIDRIGHKVKNDYVVATTRETLLRQALERQKQKANQLNESAIEYSTLKHEAETNQQLYDELQRRLKEATLEYGLKSSNVRIEQTAQVPVKPIRPNIPANIEFALFAGLLGGIVLAIFLESLDDSVRTPEEAELVSALPMLGVIPAKLKSRENGHGRVATLFGTSSNVRSSVELISQLPSDSPMAESYRALRTLMFSATSEKDLSVLLFTSPLPREGKTTTSINAALVLAHKGARVLLVDADLRNPNVHKALGMTATHGLSNVLSKKKSPREAIQQSRQEPTLFVLPAGTEPDYAELLGGSAMTQLIAEMRQQFDYVVIDSPPLLCVPDVLPLTVVVDAVVLVVRASATSRHALRRSCELLAKLEAPVLGVVVNGLETSRSDYYFYGTSKLAG